MKRLAVWVTILAIAVVGLHTVGAHLPPPPFHDLGAVDQWLAERSPTASVFCALRLLALGLAWYLLAVTTIGAMGRLGDRPRLMAAADVVTIPPVRRVLNAALSLSLTAGSMTVMSAGRTPAAVAADAAVARTASGDVAAVPTMLRLPDAPLPSPPREAPQPERQQPPHARQWTVRPGEHFWSVAERVLREEARDQPSDAQVARYWRVLVAANRDRLRDPANPDLLFPGQVLMLPAPGPAGPGE